MQHAIAPQRTEARGRRCAAPLMLAVAALALSACDAGPDPQTQQAGPRGLAASEPATIVAALARLSEFGQLRAALSATGREAQLRGNAPVTLLAPRDTAFVQLGAERQAALMAEPNRAALTRAIDGLIIPRAIRADELRQMIADGGGSASLASRAGTLTFTSEGGLLVVTAPSGIRATMGTTELATGNGMIYVLDRWIAATP